MAERENSGTPVPTEDLANVSLTDNSKISRNKVVYNPYIPLRINLYEIRHQEVKQVAEKGSLHPRKLL